MTLEEVYRWLSGLNLPVSHMWCGQLDKKKENSLGVYNSKHKRERQISIGEAKTTHIKSITLLIHADNSIRNAEKAALAVYTALAGAGRPSIGSCSGCLLYLPYEEPVYVGTDEGGVHEYVIDFDIYYKEA